MKKLLSLFLVFILILSFSGCQKIVDYIKDEPTTEAQAATAKVMIKPGWSVVQIAKALEENSVCSADSFIEACKTIPSGYEEMFKGSENVDPNSILFPVEGYLMPDTLEYYQYKDGSYALNRMLEHTKKQLDSINENGVSAYARAEELGMSMYEIMTLASVVQYEANLGSSDSNNDILQKVSSVFHNRLNSSYGYLESDATRAYITKKTTDYLTKIGIEKGSTEYNNLLKGYETYRSGTKGLPVGPVCNSTLSAVKAALWPADTDYMFFFTFTNDSGNVEFRFNRTYSAHQYQYNKLKG